MSKNWIKKLAAVLIFIISVFVVDIILNRENTELTTDMEKAQLPVVTVLSDGYKMNTMYGYKQKREEIYTRENITPLTSARKLELSINSYGSEIGGVSYEVRSADGERLIERGDITSFEEKEEELRFTIRLKDLIEEDKEYSFVTIVTMGSGEKIYYYTRFLENDDFMVKEKLDYILNFHNATLGASDGEEIKKYLESNSKGDNTDFSKVTINSSLKQVMWDQLSVRRVGEPQILIKEISTGTAMVVLKYMIATDPGKSEQYGFVEEYFRIRYTPERIYLLNYERSLEQIFQPSKEILQSDKITLGIAPKEVHMMESEGGAHLAFVSGDRLYSYGRNDNKFTRIFSFYDENNMDERTINRRNQIRILNIEDSGNITFSVAGYMNRGTHEGEVGVGVYYFDDMANTIEEQVFLPYSKSEEILMKELENLLYLNPENHLYMILEGDLCDINISEKKYEILMKGLSEERYTISTSGRMICWSEDQRVDASRRLEWMNLSNGSKIVVKAGFDEYIRALGFMGEDLIYGLAKEAAVKKEENGNILFPMYKAVIKNKEEEILKEYKKDGYFITDCQIEGNHITLNRIKETDENKYTWAENDHIASSEAEDSSVNDITTVTKDQYKTVVQIILKNTINSSTLKIMNPKEVIFEGGRNIDLEIGNEERYYVYGPYGVDMITPNSSEAITKAFELSGVVTDENGNTIWKKGTKFTKNQIMAITGKKREKEESSLAVCLDVILEYEGVSRKTQAQLDFGEDAFKILSSGLREAGVIDLTGSPMDTVLYYVDQDIPVLGLMGNSEAYLIVGFNEQNVVLMDPVTGTVYKKGMNDSREMFAEKGNQFITYIKDK
ncbi:MAG: hypothetical protein IKW28_00070 [Lachnospiraceae bacterium]|nr:hypothetical protein [Lachnospiraceae bacterium]